MTATNANGAVLRCPCGDETITGDIWTDADATAWAAEHAGHGDAAPAEPAAPTLHGVRIRCVDDAEARDVGRDMKPTHVVGRVGSVLYVKPRDGA